MGAELPASRSAQDLVRGAIRPDSRVLVTGAAGWFGRTTLALLHSTFGPGWVESHVLPTGSFARTIEVLDVGPVRVQAPPPDEVRAFSPTTIVNCAFLTRNLASELGHVEYVTRATALTDQLLWAATLPSVERAVTFSSGAAVASEKFPDDLERNPYGVLKAREEAAFLDLAGRIGKPFRVARVWSVSGPHVQRPRAYAFSDLVQQALSGRQIQVTADHPVWRRYASVADVVALTLAQCKEGPGVMDSGGQLIELGELAERIARRTGEGAGRPRRVPGEIADDNPDDYYSRVDAFAGAADRHGLTLLDLDGQIDEVIRGLRPRTAPKTSQPHTGQEDS